MMRARRAVVPVLAALAALFLLGGLALVHGDALARTHAAQDVVTELQEFYAEQQGFDIGDRGLALRSILSESVANDGPMPELHTESRQDYMGATFGAFGGAVSPLSVVRPWSPRMVVLPFAVGGVLAITVVLLLASRRDAARSSGPRGAD